MNDKETRADQAPDRQDEILRRFVGGIGEQIFNRDLICARCANLMENAAAECEIYEQKPLAVLRGEESCPEFVPRDGQKEG